MSRSTETLRERLPHGIVLWRQRKSAYADEIADETVLILQKERRERVDEERVSEETPALIRERVKLKTEFLDEPAIVSEQCTNNEPLLHRLKRLEAPDRLGRPQ
jgi:hypothetical protein